MTFLTPGIALRGFGVMVALVALGLALRWAGIDQETGARLIDTAVRNQGVTGEVLFVAVAGLATAAGLPRQLVAFLGGYAFGLALGTAMSLAGAVLGCALAFFFARWLAHDFVAARLPGRMRRLDSFLADHTFSMTLLIRLLPAGSNLLTNLTAGVSSVRAVPFIGGSAIGYIPQMVVFALLGSGINLNPEFRISASVVLFFVSAVLGVYLYRRFRRGAAFNGEVEQALAPAPEDHAG